MNLHLDRAAFRVLIERIHQRTGYREDVLEKDYYVTLILKELANKQTNGLPAYFKGGTALYKALKTTNRFSEDIDFLLTCAMPRTERRATSGWNKPQRSIPVSHVIRLQEGHIVQRSFRCILMSRSQRMMPMTRYNVLES